MLAPATQRIKPAPGGFTVEQLLAPQVPIGTVMSRLSRGRERLRQLLEEGAAGRGGLRRVK